MKLSATTLIDPDALKRWRKQRGYSQQALADKVGMSRSYLADLERGRKSNPRMTVVEGIAAAMDISPDQLL